MFSPRWTKIYRDVTSNKTRSILVVASIVVGIFAVGVVQHIRTVVVSEMQRVYVESRAGHGNIFASDVDDAMLDVIRRMPEIEDAAGSSSVSVNIEVEPGKWEPFTVNVVADFAHMRMNKLKLVTQVNSEVERRAAASTWPHNDQIVLERSSLGTTNALPPNVAVGDTLTLQTSDNRIRKVTLAGFVFDANSPPATFRGTASGYVNPSTFERLGGADTWSQIAIRVNGTDAQIADRQYVTRIADEAADKITRSGRTVNRVQVFRPGRLPLQDLFDSITLVLTPLGLLALILGGFLVINTMSALMSQQVRQIGIMKAVGARRGQIIRMYVSSVFVYSILALLTAIPLTMLLASRIELFLGNFVNLDLSGFKLPLNVFFTQVAIGLLIPILAALQPIFKGTAVTVREAVSDYGVGKGQFGTRLLDRAISQLRGLSRPGQISLRNTIRRRMRLILTLITLILGGMIFMTVGSVRSSLEQRVEQVLEYNRFDIRISLERAYRIGQIEQVARAVPGVTNVETWSNGQAVRVRADDSESDPINITALPADSKMIQPTLVSGRWLLPNDESAIVLSQSILTDEPDIKLGDQITLKIQERNQPWTVVGFAQTTEFGGNISAYVTYDYFTRLTNSVGSASSALIQVDRTPERTIDEQATLLEETFDQAGMRVGSIFTVDRIRTFTGNFFTVIVSLLLVMGVLIASVGARLAGTMSTNVLERTREIGVMRFIGASDGAVLRIVIVEGVIIGLLSWLAGGAGLPRRLCHEQRHRLRPFPRAAALRLRQQRRLQLAGHRHHPGHGGQLSPRQGASRLTVREVLA
ncbi:MAG: FtsX-like permease family protein [Caldilineaceae bacterium]